MIEVSAVQVSLSKTLNPKLLTVGLAAPCMAAAAQCCITVCVCEWVNERPLQSPLGHLDGAGKLPYSTVHLAFCHQAYQPLRELDTADLHGPPFHTMVVKYQPVRTGHLG